ncbi:Abi-alpha family protein [Weissella viridescens]|uniref:Abi-alpha family protein n=1 Tax=Weissella viridescens TaxID=1629 RepID=UPI003AF22AF1
MDSDPITEVAKASGKIADAVKVPDEVKNEVLLPAATSIGGRLGRFFKRNQVNQRASEIVEEQFLEQLSKEASLYFNNHPSATLDEAKERLIYKQIDDSTYSIDNDDMRTLFAKLIAHTADKNTNTDISPHYSQVLSNLSPSTAQLLLSMSKNSYTPMLETADPREIFIQLDRLPSSIQNTNGAIDQLASLGLIELDTLHVTERATLLEAFIAKVNQLNQNQYRLGEITFTEFGNSFINSIK